MAVFVYSREPIDWWPGWMTEEQFKASLVGSFGREDSGIADYELFRDRAFVLAKDVGWDGDIREGPFIAGLAPAPLESYSFMIAWKQDNNGETFIASAYELPWLRDDDGANVAVG